MKNISARDRLTYLNMFERYIEEYGWAYGIMNADYIRGNLFNSSAKSDTLEQIRALFGMLSDSENIYLGFAKMIGDKYGWSTKILEIGGGYYPMFAKYIDELQSKHKGGTITVMDPVLVTTRMGNAKLQRKKFSSSMDVSNFDLLVGICPCDATKDIIESAVINKKEFFVALCGCDNIPGFDLERISFPPLKRASLLGQALNLAKQQEEDGFNVSVEIVAEFPYPVISSVKVKK